MKTSILNSLLLATAIGAPALAHTVWVVPSHFVLSKTGSWVSADVSAANMTFVADKGIPVDNLALYTPDGKKQAIEHKYQGKRSRGKNPHRARAVPGSARKTPPRTSKTVR